MKTKTCKQCLQVFECRVVVNGESRNLYGRQYCLICMPFKSSRPSKAPLSLRCQQADAQRCSKCRQVKPFADFPKRADSERPRGPCRDCTNTHITDIRQSLKQECVAYKGGKCASCGYASYIGALEFHHLNPSKKDFSITTRITSKAKLENLKAELDKCICLCANCHREVHGKVKDPTGLIPAGP